MKRLKMNATKIAITILILLFSSTSYGATYYVDGTSGDDNSPGTIENPWKTIHKANATLTAGDTVYIRGGIYTVGNYFGSKDTRGIMPDKSGTSDEARITYSSYPGETVFFEATDDAFTYGIKLGTMYSEDSGKSYITVTGVSEGGMVFKNCQLSLYMGYGSHHNEVCYGDFSAPGKAPSRFWANNYVAHGATYNHIHHNKFHDFGYMVDDTSNWGDIFHLGAEKNPNKETYYNVVENNEFYHGGHGTLSMFSSRNIVRNNYMHNEEWYQGYFKDRVVDWRMDEDNLPDWKRGTGWEAVAINGDGMAYKNADGTGTLTQTIAIPAVVGTYYMIQYQISGLTAGSVTVSYGGQSDTTRTASGAYTWNMTATGTGDLVITPSNDARFYMDDIAVRYHYDDGTLYGYRNVMYNGLASAEAGYNIFEGNRVGHAGLRCSSYNYGGGGIKVCTAYNILRYNNVFANKGNALLLSTYKTSSAPYEVSRYNYIYNNTFYKNGLAYDFSTVTLGYNNSECLWDDVYCNVFKNNLYWGNYPNTIDEEVYICASPYGDGNLEAAQTCPETVPDTTKGCNLIGFNFNDWELEVDPDPHFSNPNTAYPTAWTLPDLSLESTSPCIDIPPEDDYGALTTATEASSGEADTTLPVADARYFQDAKFGTGNTLDWPSTVTMEADWIAIGAAENTVQIDSIDYSTNLITLKSAMTWDENANVWLYKKSDGEIVLEGNAPDYGAHEYSFTPQSQLVQPPRNLRILN